MGEAAEHLLPVPDDEGRVLRPVAASNPEPSHERVKSGSRPQAAKTAHWRVDLKWVFGIPFTALLMLALVFISLFQMTSRDNAVGTLRAMNQPVLAQQDFQARMNTGAPVLAGFVRSPGFAEAVYDDPVTFETALATIPAPGAVPQAENIQSGSSEETAAELAAEQQNGVRSLMGFYGLPISLLNSNTHSIFSGIMIALVVLMVLTGVPFILLSRRAGRLVSAGVSLALASWLPLLLIGAARAGMASWVDARQAETETTDGRMLADIFRPFSDNFFGSAMSVYRFIAIVSACLFLAAALYFVYVHARERRWEAQAGGQGFTSHST